MYNCDEQKKKFLTSFEIIRDAKILENVWKNWKNDFRDIYENLW